MRVGVVILPDERWKDGGWRWRRAEQLGFAHAWTYDHVGWRSLSAGPWFGALPTLIAAATSTSTIRLGTMVASPNFRHPVPFARDLLALDDVSSGRFTLGVGAGTRVGDATVLGQAELTLAERTRRFEEFVGLLDRLLTHDQTSSSGEFFSAVDAPMRPGCVQQPRLPFVVAAAGPRGMRIAARHGQGWVTTGPLVATDLPIDAHAGAAVVADQIEQLDEACNAEGREPGSVRRFALTGVTLDSGLGSVEEFGDTIGTYEAVGITDLIVHWPRKSDWFAGDLDHFESVVAEAL